MLSSSPVSHLSGRKSSASWPYMFFFLELTYWEKTTSSPFLTSIGLYPSGPPPVGRIVVSTASRLLSGTGGYNLSAVRTHQCQTRQTHDLNGPFLLSLITQDKKGIFLICSLVAYSESPITDEISPRNLSIAFGYRTSKRLLNRSDDCVRFSQKRKSKLTKAMIDNRLWYLYPLAARSAAGRELPF
jgi:hypothetical protein